MGDADDFVYHNPTAGLAVGGGEEESPEAMTDAASAVYEMLLSSDPSIIDNLMAMVELLARREPLAVAPPPPPTLPSPPVPPMTPPLPPPPPSFLLTLFLNPTFYPRLSGTDSPFPLHALVMLAQCSKDYRVALQTVAEDRWVEALSSIVGYGEDPVGTHQPVDDFPVSAFTTVNNLPNARGILDLLLPHSRLSMRDDIIRRWGVHNLLQGHAPSLPLVDVRIQAKNTLDGLVNAAKGSSKRLNLLVQGSTVIQLLENGLRPQYLYKLASSGAWDALGVTYNKDLSAPCLRANMPDSTRVGGFVVQARLIAGATMDRNGVLGRPCAHSRFCVRTDNHYSKTCIQGRDLMIGGTTVGFIGFAAIGHLSGQKDYAIHHGHLCSTSALAIRRLLLGSFQMEEIKVYI
jgi:hypothetical protein